MGIEKLVHLKELNLAVNELEELDSTKNTELSRLIIRSNPKTNKPKAPN